MKRRFNLQRTKFVEATVWVTPYRDLSNYSPQEEGTEIVRKPYWLFHNNDPPPIPTHYLRELLLLILIEKTVEFNGNNYLQTHGIAMGTKIAVSFANIYMAEIETNLIQQSNTKLREWKRYIDAWRFLPLGL